MRPIRRRMQMVYQDPYSSLDPRMTARDIIGEPLEVHGDAGDRAAYRERVDATDPAGRPLARHGRPLSARILRRAAPAHRHRARACAQSEPRHLRRGGLGARRLDPGAGGQPVHGAAGAPAAQLHLHRAQSRGRAPHLGPHRRDVSRPHRRDRAPRRALSQSAAPLHRGLAGRDPGRRSGSGGAASARHRERRSAERAQAAVRLPLPSALPEAMDMCKTIDPPLADLGGGRAVACHLHAVSG